MVLRGNPRNRKNHGPTYFHYRQKYKRRRLQISKDQRIVIFGKFHKAKATLTSLLSPSFSLSLSFSTQLFCTVLQLPHI